MNRRSNRAVPTLRDRIREVTHETILSAAETEFAEQGLRDARMEAIASKAGVAVGTLYNYFKDRDSLLTALLEARKSDLVGGVEEALEAKAKSPFRERLTVFYRTLLGHFYAHRAFLSIVMQAELGRTHSAATLVTGPGNVLKELYAWSSKLVAQGEKEKALQPGLAELFSILCIGVIRSVLLAEMLHRASELPIEVRVEQMVNFFLNGAGA
jgi:AcrR family transcriptional regulator